MAYHLLKEILAFLICGCKYVRKEITGCQTHQETFFFKTDIFPRKDALSCSMLAREKFLHLQAIREKTSH